MDKDLQDSLLKTVDILVDEVLKSTPYTSSYVGKVKKVSGFDCTVEIFGSDTECKLVEHLHGKVGVNDIVVVQDLYNDNTKKFIQCKIGSVV